LALPLVLAACGSTTAQPRPGTGTASTVAGGHQAVSAVRHVWVIEPENQGYAQTFGTPAADPYLARTLPRMGALRRVPSHARPVTSVLWATRT
jgi:hypothetical protein